jgi:molybdopterin-guanine dinucleotide biosynthesis protein A
MSVAAAILAGGGGTRMGQGGAGVVKGLLVVGGERIIDRQLAVLRPRFADLLIAANDPAPWEGLGVRVVADRAPPTRGPIAGLDAILAALPGTIDAVVCVAGDMPFLSAALLEHLRDSAPGAAALVPRVAGRPEPLLARYARSLAPMVADQMAGGRYAMVDLLARLGAGAVWIDEPELRALDPELRSTVNVNTPQDLSDLAAHDPTKRS